MVTSIVPETVTPHTSMSDVFPYSFRKSAAIGNLLSLLVDNPRWL
jgi:hypothetical protein